jgi:hypothetical protein
MSEKEMLPWPAGKGAILSKSGGTMENWEGLCDTKNQEGYLRCLRKAVERTSQLLIREVQTLDHDKVHSVKSILYAAIERVGLESERLTGVQRMLRELLILTTVQAAPRLEDKEQAMRILERLSSLPRIGK